MVNRSDIKAVGNEFNPKVRYKHWQVYMREHPELCIVSSIYYSVLQRESFEIRNIQSSSRWSGSVLNVGGN